MMHKSLFMFTGCLYLALGWLHHVQSSVAPSPASAPTYITQEGSMQKLVWSKEYVKGGEALTISLPQPETNDAYYKDIAILAYPANSTQAFSDTVLIPKVTSSIPGAKVQFLAFNSGGTTRFKSDSLCWIQYKYPQPFTCRSIIIHAGADQFRAHRLLVQVSNDGYDFTTLTRLEPPRQDAQNADAMVTHAIPAVSALYYRFVYDKAASEAGGDEPDAVHSSPALQVAGIYLSDEPVINQYEAKNGSTGWESRQSTAQQLPDSVCVPLQSIVDLTNKTSATGQLNWQAPAGNWVIVRIGHTTTSRHQNWSPRFREAFKKQHGYDLTPYLLAITGTPVQDAATSEKFLFEVRKTIAAKGHRLRHKD